MDIALKAKDNLDEHISDRYIDGDMTIEEYDLARRFPLDYDLKVNGIRHIVVKDLDHEYRYQVVDGKVISDGRF